MLFLYLVKNLVVTDRVPMFRMGYSSLSEATILKGITHATITRITR